MQILYVPKQFLHVHCSYPQIKNKNGLGHPRIVRRNNTFDTKERRKGQSHVQLPAVIYDCFDVTLSSLTFQKERLLILPLIHGNEQNNLWMENFGLIKLSHHISVVAVYYR